MKSIAGVLAFSVILTNPVLAADAVPPAPPSQAAVAGAVGPKIQFATPVYEFGRVPVGQPVKYDYIFTNTGDATLVISNVVPGCRCTIPGNYSKEVAPGATGVIPIEFDNAAQFSAPVWKAITVTCNDRTQPVVGLQLKGSVYMLVDVVPQFANLNVIEDVPSNAPVVLNIVNNMEPITLSDPVSDDRHVTAELKTLQPGKHFQLVVRAVPPLEKQSLLANIRMKTSATNMPEISIRALAVTAPSVTTNPDKIALSAGPMATAQTIEVAILNRGAQLLRLTDAVVNAPGVGVEVKEIEPGRQFTLAAIFPAGFQIAQGQNVELTVKSSNPKYQVIKVPVIQSPAPQPGGQ